MKKEKTQIERIATQLQGQAATDGPVTASNGITVSQEKL